MNINGKHYRTIWLKKSDNHIIQIIDQRSLPFKFVIEDLKTPDDVYIAIKEMHVRGAPLIGVAAAYGVYLAAINAIELSPLKSMSRQRMEGYKGLCKNFDKFILHQAKKLKSCRPTAVNLSYAVDRMLHAITKEKTYENKIQTALKEANSIANEEVENCKKIGEFGLPLIEKVYQKKMRKWVHHVKSQISRGTFCSPPIFIRGVRGGAVNILTHCNAGWLACVDYGTATAPIYMAHNKGIKVHVWVDETRPRNQGARLTAWELAQHGVPHTIIPDNTGGYLMQHGFVDIVIVGSDRTTINGDVANKIGTYLKAIAAKDNNIPFYVALPSSSIDWTLTDGIKQIPIEQRDADEVKYIEGFLDGKIRKILLTPKNSPAVNYAFDVTPARLISGLITERGICKADKKSILNLFPEKKITQISKGLHR